MGLFTSECNLEAEGPLLDVYLTVTSALASILGPDKTPPPLRCKALIDTGGTRTIIKEGLADKLALKPINTISVATANSVGHKANVYSVGIEIPGGPKVDLRQVAEMPLAKPDPLATDTMIDVLIGRDILSGGVLIYDGRRNQFTFAL